MYLKIWAEKLMEKRTEKFMSYAMPSNVVIPLLLLDALSHWGPCYCNVPMIEGPVWKDVASITCWSRLAYVHAHLFHLNFDPTIGLTILFFWHQAIPHAVNEMELN